jgi:hypothetical protein
MKTGKHKSAEEASASTSKVNSYFNTTVPKDDDLTCAVAEGVLTYHPVKHDCSFKSSDCCSKLISFILDSKFSSAHTKSESVAVNMLAALAEEELHRELNDADFI